jgi:hypothetical protein
VPACGGTLGGVRLLSPAGCQRALEEQHCGVDRYLGARMRYGMGYGLGDERALGIVLAAYEGISAN